MLAHGASRFGRILAGNAGDDARMLALDAFEISPPLGRRVNRKPHALARNDQATEEGEEARELAVAGGLGDGAMEGEILGHRALAAMERALDAAPRRADGADLAAVGALRRQGRYQPIPSPEEAAVGYAVAAAFGTGAQFFLAALIEGGSSATPW